MDRLEVFQELHKIEIDLFLPNAREGLIALLPQSDVLELSFRDLMGEECLWHLL